MPETDYGIHINDIPGIKTIKILEKRQNYLQYRIKGNLGFSEKKYLLIAEEIEAIEKVKNFLKWILNNSSCDIVEKMRESYKQGNHGNTAKANEEETQDKDVNPGHCGKFRQ